MHINRAWIDSVISVGVGSPVYERKPGETFERCSKNLDLEQDFRVLR
jgi:hypothetical protein